MKRTPLALSLFLIASLASAGEKAAEVPKLGSISAPLSSSVSNLPTSGVGSLSIPQLPPTGMPGPAGPTAAAAASPPGPAGPTAAAAPPAPPNAPPYYVEALVKLGAPRELAINLSAAQNARFATVSNADLELARAREAADIMARTTEGRAGYTLSKPQKSLLIVTSALRGADLDKDKATADLVAFLGRQLGFSLGQAKTLLAAAKPGMGDAAKKAAKDAVAKAALVSFGQADASWASEWADRLTYFERASSFSKNGAGVKMTESPADIKELSRDPNLVFLPVALQSQIKQEALRLAGAPATGPPGAALQDLQSAASQPDAAAVKTSADSLRSLADKGWAVLPENSVLSAADTQFILNRADENWPGQGSPFRTWDLLEGKTWRVNNIHDEAIVAISQRLLQRLTGMLNAATPGEDLVPIGFEIRLGNDRPTGMHVDGSYITATLALRGPGTYIYEETASGGVNIVRAKTGETAVITNIDRDFLTGVEGTVHSTPPPTDPMRVVVIIRYRAARTPELNNLRQSPKYLALDEANKKRVGKIAKVLQAREPSKKAQASGLKGIWSKLFE